jgi:hypothetical protein
MLETEKLGDLSCLLKEMTRPGISHPKFARLLIMGRLLSCSLMGLVLLGLAFFWLPTLPQRFEITSSELHDALSIVNCLFLLLILVSVTILIAALLYIARHRKEFSPYLNPSVKDALYRDAEFIKQLLTFDKATLAYGLLQYSFRWSTHERDMAALVGDLRKLGLFPALAALFISISAAILFKGDSNPSLLFLRDFVAIVVIFYAMAFLALSRERPKQVIQLLEYAIQHADQCNATPSDVNH